MLRLLLRRALPYRQYATRQRRKVITPVVDIESQISEFPEDQRKQIMEQVHGELPHIDQTEVGGDDFTANLILEFLENAESPADLDEGFWRSVRGLAKSATRKRNPEYLEIYAALFDSAKTIESPKLRQDMLYMIGRYIYRQKQVRMDPINEVEFLDTLVAKGRVFNALNLWRSRQAKEDVAGSVYWPEVGALYYIEAGLLRSADAIAIQMTDNLDGYTPPRVVVALIEAYSRQIRRDRDVPFAQQRLEAWATKLLSASLIYRNPAGEQDEAVDLEDKLQERKEVTAIDLTRALTAIIAARQWDLAARVYDSFDEIDNEDLMRALEASNSSKCGVEEYVMPFLDQILNQGPGRVSVECVAATLAVSLARSGDLDDMIEILKDMSSRQVELPDTSQVSVARAILSQRAFSLEEKIGVISRCLTSPSAMREVMRVLRKRSDNNSVAQYWAHYDGEINNSLALEVLRSKMVKDEAGLLRLGVSQDTWKYIWYLIASKKVSLDPGVAFKAMLEQVDESTLALSESVVSWVISAMLVDKSISLGVANALDALSILSVNYNIPITRANSTVLLETVKKLSNGQQALFTPPSKRDIATETLQNVQHDNVTLADIESAASEILKRSRRSSEALQDTEKVNPI